MAYPNSNYSDVLATTIESRSGIVLLILLMLGVRDMLRQLLHLLC